MLKSSFLRYLMLFSVLFNLEHVYADDRDATPLADRFIALDVLDNIPQEQRLGFFSSTEEVCCKRNLVKGRCGKSKFFGIGDAVDGAKILDYECKPIAPTQAVSEEKCSHQKRRECLILSAFDGCDKEGEECLYERRSIRIGLCAENESCGCPVVAGDKFVFENTTVTVKIPINYCVGKSLASGTYDPSGMDDADACRSATCTFELQDKSGNVRFEQTTACTSTLAVSCPTK